MENTYDLCSGYQYKIICRIDSNHSSKKNTNRMNTIQCGRVNMRKFVFVFLAINIAVTGADNPPPAQPTTPAPGPAQPTTPTPGPGQPTTPAPGPGQPTTPTPAPGGSNSSNNCNPAAPNPTNKDTVKVQLFIEAGVPDDIQYVKTVLDFRAKLKDPNVLDLSFMIGAGSSTDESGNSMQCPTKDEGKYDCAADTLLACVLDAAPADKKLDTMKCVANGTDPKACGTQVCQLKPEDVDSCVQQKGQQLIKATIDACTKFQPPMNDYPSAVFEGVYDNCTAGKAYDDFASVFCAMLNPGKGEGACPSQQGNP